MYFHGINLDFLFAFSESNVKMILGLMTSKGGMKSHRESIVDKVSMGFISRNSYSFLVIYPRKFCSEILKYMYQLCALLGDFEHFDNYHYFINQIFIHHKCCFMINCGDEYTVKCGC